ncbi:hypothetical protein QYF61_027590 [Mycteria americana]|uniref:Uncharacterized protein n=1 Tax=Mycteria americana TaxID=33587 RepID=A0AAN7MTR8_MYCAM|nr:hypothetical protein QYF61_027590 [Mycteria americana]
MDPGGTPLITILHLDIEPLTSTIWMQSYSQFLIHRTSHPSNTYLSNLERRMFWGTMGMFYKETFEETEPFKKTKGNHKTTSCC